MANRTQPTRGEIITALNRMATGTRQHGHFSMCRLDAAWTEAAIKMLIRDYDALKAVVTKHGGMQVGTEMQEAAALIDSLSVPSETGTSGDASK